MSPTSSIPYHLVKGADGEQTLTVFAEDEPLVVKGDHPNFHEILEIAEYPDTFSYDRDECFDEIRTLADPIKTVAKNMTALSERVSVFGKTIFFDGDPLESTLTDHIVRLLDNGQAYGEGGWKALVAFLEKLATNPVPHSQHRLYGWLEANDGFTIAEDGDIIAYKGVNVDLNSVRSGPGIVNGVEQDGHLSNAVGNVVEMARSEVEHDPGRGCSVGLHAGTYEYAQSWGPRVVTVKFSPRDVVSVPTDSGDAKVRVCRYEVIAADTAEQYDAPVFSLGD